MLKPRNKYPISHAHFAFFENFGVKKEACKSFLGHRCLPRGARAGSSIKVARCLCRTSPRSPRRRSVAGSATRDDPPPRALAKFCEVRVSEKARVSYGQSSLSHRFPVVRVFLVIGVCRGAPGPVRQSKWRGVYAESPRGPLGAEASPDPPRVAIRHLAPWLSFVKRQKDRLRVMPPGPLETPA